MTDEDLVTLLALSRAAHFQYRQSLPGGPSPNPATARASLQRAYDLRLEAENADPNLTSPAFRNEPEKFTHGSVMAFYRQMLARPA